MKIKKKDLNKIILEYLNKDNTDILREGEFGSIKVGPKFEFCDLSERIPPAIVGFFQIFRDSETKAIQTLLKNEKDPQRRLQIQEDLAAAQVAGKFESIFASNTFSIILKGLGPGLSFLTLADKVTCDYLIDVIFAFFGLTVVPLLTTLGFDTSSFEVALGNAEAREKASRNKSAQSGDAAAVVTPSQKFNDISIKFSDNRITNEVNRNSVKDNMLRADLKHHHFDLFELFAVNEYNDYVLDPTAEIPDTALNKFKSAGNELRNNGTTSFTAFINSYVLATEGTTNDSNVRSILSTSNLEESFENAEMASLFIRQSLDELLHSDLDFEGVTFLTSV